MCKNVFVKMCLCLIVLFFYFVLYSVLRFFTLYFTLLYFYIVDELLPIINLWSEASSDLWLWNVYIPLDHNMLFRIIFHLIRYIEVIHIRVPLHIGKENA